MSSQDQVAFEKGRWVSETASHGDALNVITILHGACASSERASTNDTLP